VSREYAKCTLVTRVCVSVARRIPTLLQGPGCKLENGRGCPLVVHYWVDLQLVNGFHCYNRAPNAKCQRVPVLALCLVHFSTVQFSRADVNGPVNGL